MNPSTVDDVESAETQSQIRVVSVPSGHPYVDHLTADDESTRVRREPDPRPVGAAPGQWWPPVVFDGAWLRAHRDDFDLFHVHFGVESFSLDTVDDLIATLAELDKPLVYTIHDLENPQLHDQAHHVAQLDRLVKGADALITLTAGAARETLARWGRLPVVIPHPNVFPLAETIPDGAAAESYVVGMHLRDLRPNIDAVVAVETLLSAVTRLHVKGVSVVARIHVNERVRDASARDRVAALVEAHPSAELSMGPRLSDRDLARSLADLDLAVLPYGHGTHSGWVELCFDLGVAVVGPRVGHMGDQHPDTFRAFDSGDAASLATAISDTITSAGATRPGTPRRLAETSMRREMRREQRREIDRAHVTVYESVLVAP